MKFCFVEEDFESFSLSEDGMLAIPMSISQNTNEEAAVTSYKICEDVALEFCSLFKENPFSSEARAYLLDRLSPLMESYSLYPTEETGDMLLELRTVQSSGYSGKAIILGTNEEISSYPSDTTLWRLEVDDEDPFDVISAVVEDDRIAAFAAVNDISGSGAEINVECAVSARRQGYATECVRCLTDYLLSRGAEAVTYVCREKNVASTKTALKAGFTLTGKSMNFVFYR